MSSDVNFFFDQALQSAQIIVRRRGRELKNNSHPILTIALREADETLYWLELLADSETINPELLADIINEYRPLVAILSASVRTARMP